MSTPKKPNKSAIDQLISNRKKHTNSLTFEQLVDGIKHQNRGILSESITLVESSEPHQAALGQKLLQACLPLCGNSIRIGITGVPCVGKSTFIEELGLFLANLGKKVAVLAIDPSSEVSKGSILGDKTRMNNLAVHPNAYIRPTATSGSLGGVARKTRETILLTEAAGFEVILIETVGVGQSETEVHSMTDFFLLLMLAGAGDELQGIKRGIMEMADAILITKTDGENIKKANLARAEYKNALHLFPAKPNEWIPRVETVSSAEKRGIEKTWEIITSFDELVTSNGHKSQNREAQQIYWMNETVKEQLLAQFANTAGIQEEIINQSAALKAGKTTSYQAANHIINYYKNAKR